MWSTLENENILPVYQTNFLQHITIFITLKMTKSLETALTPDYVQHNSLVLNMVKVWFSQVLDYLHCIKLCNMDIKGDNILIRF